MKIYVMTHKKFDIPMDDIYVPLHVGREISDDLGYMGDNTGENISDLNPFFGELTGLYWVWQNDTDSDYIGICHYRRFLSGDDGILDEQSLLSLLSKYDCLTSEMPEGEIPNIEAYAEAHPVEDIQVIKKSVEKLFPEYTESFNSVMNDNKACYGNICVMPRNMYESYCRWLFTILFDASESIDLNGRDLYQRRVYGFLAELLLNVYILGNGYNAGRIRVIYTDEKAETKELRAAVNNLISQRKYSEARSFFEEILKVRPDVALPASDVVRHIPIIDFITGVLVLEEKNGCLRLPDISDNILGMIDYYRDVHAAFSGDADKENYIKSNPPSPVFSALMVKNDISEFTKLSILSEEKVDKILQVVYNDSEYTTYLGYKKIF